MMDVHNTPTISRTKDSINWLGIVSIVIIVLLGMGTLYITADEVLTPEEMLAKEKRCNTIGKLAKVVVLIKEKDKSLEQILNRLNAKQNDTETTAIIKNAYGMIDDKEFLVTYNPEMPLAEQVEQTFIGRCLAE